LWSGTSSKAPPTLRDGEEIPLPMTFEPMEEHPDEGVLPGGVGDRITPAAHRATYRATYPATYEATYEPLRLT